MHYSFNTKNIFIYCSFCKKKKSWFSHIIWNYYLGTAYNSSNKKNNSEMCWNLIQILVLENLVIVLRRSQNSNSIHNISLINCYIRIGAVSLVMLFFFSLERCTLDVWVPVWPSDLLGGLLTTVQLIHTKRKARKYDQLNQPYVISPIFPIILTIFWKKKN